MEIEFEFNCAKRSWQVSRCMEREYQDSGKWFFDSYAIHGKEGKGAKNVYTLIYWISTQQLNSCEIKCHFLFIIHQLRKLSLLWGEKGKREWKMNPESSLIFNRKHGFMMGIVNHDEQRKWTRATSWSSISCWDNFKFNFSLFSPISPILYSLGSVCCLTFKYQISM